MMSWMQRPNDINSACVTAQRLGQICAQTDRREEGEKDAGENRTEDIERETKRIEKKAKEHMKDVDRKSVV